MKVKFFSGFVITTLFNFLSISALLYSTLRLIPNKAEATLIAQALGLIVSMYFTIDFWWLRISKEMKRPVKILQRFKFLSIGSISAITAWLIIKEISAVSELSNLQVIVINWLSLAVISVLKYALFVMFVQKNRITK